MKKLLIVIVFAGLVLPCFAQHIIDENAEKRPVPAFHRIQVSSAFDVYLSQGNEDAVAVSASQEKYRDRISAEVKNGTLVINYDSKGGWGRGNHKLKAYISFREIDKLTVSGACDVFTTGTIKAESLEIRLSGASDLKTTLDVKKLNVDLNGASDILASGTARELDIEVSGGSNFKGYDLITDFCNARATGASDIKITVNKELSAQASGASDVRYKGEGQVKNAKNSGSSSISKG